MAKKQRGNKPRTLISPEQFVSAINETTRMYQSAVSSVTQVTKGIKALSGFINDVRGLIPEEKVKDAAALLKTMSENNGDIINTLTSLNDVVKEPPQYYPYSTERLDLWTMQVSSGLVGDIGEKLQFNLAGLADLTLETESWANTLPQEDAS